MSDAFHDAGESYGFSCGGNVTKDEFHGLCKDVSNTKSKKEPVDNPVIPDHYNKQCSLSCIESMIAVLGMEGTYHFCLGSCYKYLWRFSNKNGKEDVMKVSRYLYMASEIYLSDMGKHGYETPEFIRMVDLYNRVCYSIGEMDSFIDIKKFTKN